MRQLKFPNKVIGYIKHWSQRPTVLLLSGSLLILTIILTLAGGLLFWTYQFTPVFASYNSGNQSEFEVARSVMQNMKRMVGDQAAWSESIKEEYNNLVADQLIEIQPINHNYNENVVGLNYPINQKSTNQMSTK